MVSGRTASPELYAFCQQSSLRARHCSGLMRCTHWSYAKFGPPECEARNCEIARSQRSGCSTNRRVARCTAGNPSHTGRQAPYMMPAAWDSGDQVTSRLSAEKPEPSAERRQLASTFPCEIITPLAVPVEPDVYCRLATLSSSSIGARQRSAYSAPIRSIWRRGTSRSPGDPASASASCASPPEFVSTQCGDASLATASSLRSTLSRGPGSGSASGAAIAPAYRHPQNAEMKSSPEGNRSNTGFPDAPCSTSRAPIARARLSSSPYES